MTAPSPRPELPPQGPGTRGGWAELAGPAIVLAIGVLAGGQAWRYGLWDGDNPGSGLLPIVASALLVAFSLLDLRGRLADRARATSAPAREPVLWSRVAAYAGALAGLVAAMQFLGFVVTALVSICIAVRYGEGRRWGPATLVASFGVLFAWLLFAKLLSVPLPAGRWLAGS